MYGILSHFAPLRNKICDLTPIFPILKPPVFRPVNSTRALLKMTRPTCRPRTQNGAQDVDRSQGRWDGVGSYAESVAGPILNPNFSPARRAVADARPDAPYAPLAASRREARGERRRGARRDLGRSARRDVGRGVGRGAWRVAGREMFHVKHSFAWKACSRVGPFRRASAPLSFTSRAGARSNTPRECGRG